MPSTTEVTLVLIPMAIYLYALGFFHGGKHPKLISGVADLAGLEFSLSGLVAFGPVGQVAVTTLFGTDATSTGWSVWLASLVVLGAFTARTGRNRLVIYHIEPEQVRTATQAALLSTGQSFLPTLNGFEDAASQSSLMVRVYPRMRTAVLEAEGASAHSTMTLLRPGLRQALGAIDEPVSSLSTAFFTISGLVMLGPVVGFLLLDPQGKRLVRVVGQWVGWR